MSDIQMKLVSYIQNEIYRVYDKLKSLNDEIVSLESFLDNFKKHNSSFYYYEGIYNQIDRGISFQKFIDCIRILDSVDYQKLENEPQIKEILSLTEKWNEALFELVDKKKKEYQTLIKEYQDKKDLFNKYLLFIEGDYHILDDELLKEGFIDFVKHSSMEQEIIDNLIQYATLGKISYHSEKNIKEEKYLPVLDESLKMMAKQYFRILDELNPKEKNALISANTVLHNNSSEDVESIAYGFNKQEIDYYCTILDLLDNFINYQQLCNDNNIKDAELDEELWNVLAYSLKEAVDNITKSLAKLKTIEKEVEEDPVDIKNDLHNLVLFLDIDEIDKKGNPINLSVLDYDLDYIKEQCGGEADDNIKNLVRMLNNRLVSMPYQELRELGHDANKHIVGTTNKLFEEFNVFSSRGRGNNPSRITYFRLPVSEANKRELIIKYHLPMDANIYLVVGMFIKKNESTEYVRITGNRLFREYDKIKKIEEMFQKDFDDYNRKKVDEMLEDSLDLLNSLNGNYQDEKSIR